MTQAVDAARLMFLQGGGEMGALMRAKDWTATSLGPPEAWPPALKMMAGLLLAGRDAMAPHGGRLTIETANRWLDDRAARERDGSPGQYVSLCVTDSGTGMTQDVIERAFDPFFTTKPRLA